MFVSSVNFGAWTADQMGVRKWIGPLNTGAAHDYSTPELAADSATWSFPPEQGRPYRPKPGFNPQQQPSQGWQQQGPWEQPPPPSKRSTIKWLLIAVAVLLVIAISIGGTLLFTRNSGSGSAPPSASSPSASDVASAGDTRPVGIIAADPTCNALASIGRILADVQANGWSAQHATLGPESEWTAEQRSQVKGVVTAIQNAADQMVDLAKQTPHRVMRELYEQYIAYGRAYAESIPTYVPQNNSLADVNVNVGNAAIGICNSIMAGSASRGLTLSTASPPTESLGVGDVSDPQRLSAISDPTCAAWQLNSRGYLDATKDWERIGSGGIPASDWSPAQQVSQQRTLPIMSAFADQMEATGRQSDDPIFEDFAILAAVYLLRICHFG